MTAWYSLIGGVFRVGRGVGRGRCNCKNHGPGEGGGQLRELQRNHQRQAPTPLRNRAHSAGFQLAQSRDMCRTKVEGAAGDSQGSPHHLRESFIKAPACFTEGMSVMPAKLFRSVSALVFTASLIAAVQVASAATPAELQKARHEHYEELGDAFKAVRDASKARQPRFRRAREGR